MPPPAQPDLTEPRQTSSRVLLIRPGSFGRNEAAADSNAFMHELTESARDVADRARRESDGLGAALSDAGIEVLIDDEPDLPDSVFPNNWMSYHEPHGRNPVLVTYPMATPLRRLERRASVVDRIRDAAGGTLEHIQLEHLESAGGALEGTGSLVLDRVAGVAFACRSARTTDAALDAWEAATGFDTVRFDAVGADGTPVYHTNVIMSVGTDLAILASDTIASATDRSMVIECLGQLGKAVVEITNGQMGDMGANALELRTSEGEPVLAMSERAWGAFDAGQRRRLERAARPVVAGIPTIENIGGGSVRCMIAELGASKH